jgi:hypothetical protein
VRPTESDRLQLPTGRRHGTASGYAYGCHCADCRAAINAAVAERRAVNAEKLRLGLVDVPHGELNTYANYLCRCPECTEANRRYCAEWRDRRRKAGLG